MALFWECLPPRTWPPDLIHTIRPGQYPDYSQRFEIVKMACFTGVHPRVCFNAMVAKWVRWLDKSAVRHVSSLCGGEWYMDYAPIVVNAYAWWCVGCRYRHIRADRRPRVAAALLNATTAQRVLLLDECWLDAPFPGIPYPT